MIGASELKILIKKCKARDPASQKQLYLAMYNYGMTIANNYAYNNQEVEEIANDAFFKMLDRIHQYNEDIPFKLWLRRIVINCGIDHYRKYGHQKFSAIEETLNHHKESGIVEKLNYNDLILMVRKLSPAYRIVFTLYIVEGYNHREISEKLNISIGASKSNLFKAKQKLKLLINAEDNKIINHG